MLAVVVMFGILSVFSTGSCYHHDSHHCDDHHDDADHHCDDDHWNWHFAMLPGTGGKYAIDQFQLVPSYDPKRHPVAWLYEIEGVNPFHFETMASHTGIDFERFTGMLIAVNDELIGLPASAGRLTFADVEFTEDGFQVRWIQETWQPEGSWRRVPAAELVFAFDPIGNLVTVQNGTWLRPPVLR